MSEVGKVMVFPQSTSLSNMKSIFSGYGYYLNDVIDTDEYETYVEETLYTSLNQIRFFYSTDGGNSQFLKNGNHILYPTPTGYNLYTIDNVAISTDDGILQVDAQHYSVNYMRDSAHEIAIGKNAKSIASINETLQKSAYVSNDFELRGEGTSEGAYELTDDTYITSLSNSTVGSVLVGANSLLRKYFGQYLRRSLDHLGAFKIQDTPSDVQRYPIILGINVIDMDYSIDTSNIYTTAITSANTLPNLKIPGGDSIGGKLSGLGGSLFNSLDEMPVGLRMRAVYKGLPLELTKTDVGVSVKVGLIEIQGKGERVDPIPESVCTYNNGYLLVKSGETDFINELINPDFFYAVNVINTLNSTFPDKEFLGKDTFKPHPQYTYTTDIPSYVIQYPNRADTIFKGNAVKYLDYETFDSKMGAEDERNIRAFYYYHLVEFGKYWDTGDSYKLLEPTFEAKFTIDDMKTLYGEEIVNNQIFRVGDLYNVIATEYDLEFTASITKTKYNGLTGDLIEIEFGNKQDLELERLKTTNINKPNEKSVATTPKKPNETPRPTPPTTQPIDKPTLEDLLELDPPGLIVNELTDDGPERIEWVNPIVYISPKSAKTTNLEMNVYNRTSDYGNLNMVAMSNIRLSATTSTDWNKLNSSTLGIRIDIPDSYVPLIAKPDKTAVGGNRYNYKSLLNTNSYIMPNSLELPQSWYDNTKIATQMTYDAWLNLYEKEGKGGGYYFSYKQTDGVFTNEYKLKEAHDVIYNTLDDNQLATLIRSFTIDDFKELKDDIIGKTVQELYAEADGHTTEPISKDYVIKRLKWVAANSAERSVRYNLDNEDYRSVSSTEPSVPPPVETTYRMYATTKATSARHFHGGCKIEYEPVTRADGSILSWRVPSDGSGVTVTKLFQDSQSLVKYAYENFIAPLAAMVVSFTVPGREDIPVTPVIISSHSESGYNVRGKVKELERLYANLAVEEKEEFELRYGSYERNYLLAQIVAGKHAHGESIVVTPEILAKEKEMVNGELDKHWENVYSYMITKGKIDKQVVIPEEFR